MRPVLVSLLAAFAFALAACSSGDAQPTAEPTPTLATPTAAAASSSPGVTVTTASATPSAQPTPAVVASPAASVCSGAIPPGLAVGESRLQQLSVGVDIRTYRVYLPSTFSNTRFAPLVLNFHGLGGSAEIQETISGLIPVAEREGFILVSPQGMGVAPSWNFGAGQGIFPGGPDDFGFVAGLLNGLADQLCIDQSRVYATGFSNGAFFVSALACQLPGRFAAIAPVAGVDAPAAGCPAVVPLIAFHGTEDPVVPFQPGSIYGLLRYDGARASVAGWSELGGCDAAAYPSPIGANSSLETYDCDGDVQVALVVVDGLQHAWPDFAADEIWEFFDRYTLPG